MDLVFGYDPGGNDKHGVAALQLGGAPTNANQPVITGVRFQTVQDAESALGWFQTQARDGNVHGLGVDTLTQWATGSSGWRPADIELREEYRRVQNSVTSPNGLYSSMSLNGMAVVIELRSRDEKLVVSETHPKVLYHALTDRVYNFIHNGRAMVETLEYLLELENLQVRNDHEWDALISAYAVLQGLLGNWTRDLHASDPDPNRYVCPAGKTHYFWPTPEEVRRAGVVGG